jgi:hypothetical protein
MTDIAQQFAQEMNLSPEMMDRMQQQQGYGYQQPSGPQISEYSPEQQMAMMQYQQQMAQQQMVQAQQQQQQPSIPQQNYDSDSDTSSSELDLDTLGMNKQTNFMDNIMQWLRDPLMMILLFFIFSLPYLDNMVRPLLPALISGGIYYALLKSFIAGLVFIVFRMVIV